MSEYLKMISGKHLFLVIGVLYITLWLIDIHKAKEVLGGVVGIGESIVQNILLIKNKISPKPAGNTPAKATPSTLPQFLATPNKELLKMRNGLYNRPAGYYIEVNSDKGTCTAKYSKEYGGRWATPAKILCPQIKEFWSKGSTPQK